MLDDKIQSSMKENKDLKERSQEEKAYLKRLI